jgi:GDSL-like Lipase/Acylhydrolase family
VTATPARHVRAVLIGVLTILALTGTGAPVVRAVMHQQILRRQILAAQRAMPQPVERMVAVGDSITKGDWDVDEAGGWVTRLVTKLRAAYPHARFQLDNAGLDGDMTAGVLARLARDVLAPHPQLVIISIGTNDFDYGVPRTQFAAQLQTLVQRMAALFSVAPAKAAGMDSDTRRKPHPLPAMAACLAPFVRVSSPEQACQQDPCGRKLIGYLIPRKGAGARSRTVYPTVTRMQAARRAPRMLCYKGERGL